MPVAAPEVRRLPAFTAALQQAQEVAPDVAEVVDDLVYALCFDDVPLAPVPGRPGWFAQNIHVPAAAGGVAKFLVVFQKTPSVETNWATPPFTVTLAGLL
ncbi:MAG: hypothetical protein Q8P41_18415 [Pseudomonadota bacterium]|nr:hypothetical protein [Pseudomonadota bacterium]